MPEPTDALVVAATGSPIGRADEGSLVDKRADEINDLRTCDGHWDLETMCAAGGMAMATVVERLHG